MRASSSTSEHKGSLPLAWRVGSLRPPRGGAQRLDLVRQGLIWLPGIVWCCHHVSSASSNSCMHVRVLKPQERTLSSTYQPSIAECQPNHHAKLDFVPSLPPASKDKVDSEVLV